MGNLDNEAYAPLNLWIREDQMMRLTEEAYERSITIYSLIRQILDYYYYDGKPVEKSKNE